MSSGIVESQDQEQDHGQDQNQNKQGEAQDALQQPGGGRSRLVQRLLAASANLSQFIDDLLRTQAVMVAGTEAAGFIFERTDAGMTLRNIAHVRPDNSTAETRAAAITAFQEIIKPCIEQQKDGAIEVQGSDGASEAQYCLVTVLRTEKEIIGASAVITRCRDLERAQQRLVSMQLVAGYFELYTLRRQSEQSQIVAHSHQHVLQLATAVATAEGFESAGMNLCNELATRTGAGRVALGWIKGRSVRVKALSHTEEFDKKQELIKQLEDVMEESIDQEEPVQFDPDGTGTGNVSRCAQNLSRTEGGNTVLTLPLRRRADIVGAITLEFPAAHKISPQASTGLAVAVDLLAPQLYDRYQNDRWLITKVGLSAKELAKEAIGPQHMIAKTLSVVIPAAIVFICLFRPMYHVSAPFQFDSVDKRRLDAPIDGYIKQVLVKPGDTIKAGQVLLSMDTSDLQLKLADSNAEAAKYQAEYSKDAADPEKQADAAIAMAEKQASLADSKLYQDQIDRAQIKAPFDGVVLKGDLTDEVLAPKKQGDELFTVAATSGLRANLAVSDRDIQELKVTQIGYLATTSLPTEKFKFTLNRIVPLGEPKEGENIFTVYAHLDQTSPEWRPGMAGEARVEVGKRRLIWIWTHKLVDWFRLKLWSF